LKLAMLDLPEGNAMRAPGEAPGMMALEIAMDEMAERLKLDPIEFRSRNDTQVDHGASEQAVLAAAACPVHAHRAERFGWNARLPQPARSAMALAGRHRHGCRVPQHMLHEVRRARSS